MRGLGKPREKAPLLIHIGSSGQGEVYVCPECGEQVVRPKMNHADNQSVPKKN